MKKMFFWMLAAILTNGFILTSCSDDDDAKGESYTDLVEE